MIQSMKESNMIIKNVLGCTLLLCGLSFSSCTDEFEKWNVLYGDISIVNNSFTMPDTNVSIEAIFSGAYELGNLFGSRSVSFGFVIRFLFL